MTNSEQKAWRWWGAVLAILLALALATSGCGRKPMPTIETHETDRSSELTRINHDLNTEVVRNRAVIDSLKIYVGNVSTGKPDCDSVCQVAVDRLLEQLQRQIVSGDNRFQIVYDKLQKQLSINTRLGETINKLKEERHDSISLKLRTTTITTTITKHHSYVPDFWRYSAYLGWLFVVIIIGYIFKRIPLWLATRSIS